MFDSIIHIGLTVLYLLVMLLVSIYGLHRYWITVQFYRHRRKSPRANERFNELPKVTVQLPMYNERLVAKRIIEAACAIDYPSGKLQVQVLDDSTDGSKEYTKSICDTLNAQGHNVLYVHRDNRNGFKAGALNEGLDSATGEFVAIFDADFVPPTNVLKRTINYFTDPAVGMVQTCWDHLNRRDSILTRSQAIFLDGHFLIEHTARNRAGNWMNFNGTAGIWRKETIHDAGGWQHDTLTEDVDLSYRAQLKGWNFIYVPRVKCPAELPPEITAFKSQQHRWTKGSIESAKKLLLPIFRSKATLGTKIEAFFHLTSPMVYLYVTMMTLLFFPVFYLNIQLFEPGAWQGTIYGFMLFMLATVSAGAFYIASQKARRVPTWKTLLHVPFLMSIGIGISLNNARAVIEALVGHKSGFVRTPKYNAIEDIDPLEQEALEKSEEIDSVGEAAVQGDWKKTASSIRLPVKVWVPCLEVFMGAYMLGCIYIAVAQPTAIEPDPRQWFSVPFLCLFAMGYFYVGFMSFKIFIQQRFSAQPAMAG